jgi:hypothetical protein
MNGNYGGCREPVLWKNSGGVLVFAFWFRAAIRNVVIRQILISRHFASLPLFSSFLQTTLQLKLMDVSCPSLSSFPQAALIQPSNYDMQITTTCHRNATKLISMSAVGIIKPLVFCRVVPKESENIN